ncbi:hypothetical protein E4U43_004117 [Claviceps pusilla]|uniref:Uncharacterized protein n=1 Tax=Claviceps pusilla TaxID=123648 RepID=A0A9P7SX89_9HYPO|nr:hypothetical protein E4U43_004117 [Claviceps pusilla]
MIAMVAMIVVRRACWAALVSHSAAPLALRATVAVTRAGRARGTERRPSTGNNWRSFHAPAKGGELAKAAAISFYQRNKRTGGEEGREAGGRQREPAAQEIVDVFFGGVVAPEVTKPNSADRGGSEKMYGEVEQENQLKAVEENWPPICPSHSARPSVHFAATNWVDCALVGPLALTGSRGTLRHLPSAMPSAMLSAN